MRKASKAAIKRIRESLEYQLKIQGMTQSFIQHWVEDYMRLFDLKETLFEDIEERGITVTTINGNGINVNKPNDSVTNVIKVMSQMETLLDKLDLKNPVTNEDGIDDDYL